MPPKLKYTSLSKAGAYKFSKNIGTRREILNSLYVKKNIWNNNAESMRCHLKKKIICLGDLVPRICKHLI
jgi:hypothetical protein